MQLDCDVAVVGAGPAGSRTARHLARAGLSVRLLEEHRRVGVPSHCSGLISPRTLREAEIGEDAIIHRITGAFVHTAHGSEVALGGDKTRAVAIDRVRWDETLAEQAQVAGADLVRARLTGVERENSHVRLHTQTDGRDSTFTARVVVGDDVLLVRDAAGQVQPFAGGGIYAGLVAARQASAAVLRAFENDDCTAAGLGPYERAWKREIGRELLRSLRIRHFGLALSEGEVERVVGALRSEGLQQLASRHGDIDYPSRVLLRLARSLPALGLLAWITLRRPAATWTLFRANLPFAL